MKKKIIGLTGALLLFPAAGFAQVEPDLVITDMLLNQQIFDQNNEPLTLEFTINNYGETDATGFGVKAYIDMGTWDEPLFYTDPETNPLSAPAGTSVTYKISGYTGFPSIVLGGVLNLSHDFKLEVDFDDRVDEGTGDGEFNNVLLYAAIPMQNGKGGGQILVKDFSSGDLFSDHVAEAYHQIQDVAEVVINGESRTMDISYADNEEATLLDFQTNFGGNFAGGWVTTNSNLSASAQFEADTVCTANLALTPTSIDFAAGGTAAAMLNAQVRLSGDVVAAPPDFDFVDIGAYVAYEAAIDVAVGAGAAFDTRLAAGIRSTQTDGVYDLFDANVHLELWAGMDLGINAELAAGMYVGGEKYQIISAGISAGASFGFGADYRYAFGLSTRGDLKWLAEDHWAVVFGTYKSFGYEFTPSVILNAAWRATRIAAYQLINDPWLGVYLKEEHQRLALEALNHFPILKWDNLTDSRSRVNQYINGRITELGIDSSDFWSEIDDFIYFDASPLKDDAVSIAELDNALGLANDTIFGKDINSRIEAENAYRFDNASVSGSEVEVSGANGGFYDFITVNESESGDYKVNVQLRASGPAFPTVSIKVDGVDIPGAVALDSTADRLVSFDVALSSAIHKIELIKIGGDSLFVDWYTVAKPLPDLAVTALNITGDTISVTIENQGDADITSTFFTDVYINYPVGGFGNVWSSCSSLEAGASVTFDLDYTAAGAITVYALVDTDDIIVESDEDNNVRGPVIYPSAVLSVLYPSYNPANGIKVDWNRVNSEYDGLFDKYGVVYKKDNGAYSAPIFINNINTTEYTITRLGAGQYQIKTAVFDNEGSETEWVSAGIINVPKKPNKALPRVYYQDVAPDEGGLELR